ncbi:DUF1566 domain-containing protein [Desulfonatronovibrio magnus]|uniref:Lcl C-terminal domain-containing protein n=1 Tax=Desulfonatronovibrio magnus TaxID=698827 RepID=UPI0005EBA380|nr:DUF1566 domain-containing protein [Desulfonatronovibrio magnus]
MLSIVRMTIVTLVFMLCLTGLVMSDEAQAQRLVDNGNGTVTDNGRGLMWQKTTVVRMNWDDAMSYASSLAMGGHTGWRLPTMFELAELYHSDCKNLMDVQNRLYWSSTTDPFYTNTAWLVYFYNGYFYSYFKYNTYYVRAVRWAQ